MSASLLGAVNALATSAGLFDWGSLSRDEVEGVDDTDGDGWWDGVAPIAGLRPVGGVPACMRVASWPKGGVVELAAFDGHGLREAIPGLLCVEMEGAAVAQVCHEYRLPYLVIRTISDHADNDAPEDFTSFIEHTAKEYSAGILTELLPKVVEALRIAE